MSILLSTLALAAAPQAVDPAGTLQRIDVPADPAGAVVLDVNLSGAPAEIVLEPHSVRAGDFSLHVSRPDGSLIKVPAPAPRTWRGTVTGWPTASVTASITDEGLSAIVIDETLDSEWQIQPALGHPEGVYSVALKSELVVPPGTCGVPDGAQAIEDELAGVARSSRGSGLRLAEIAIDADFEFYQRNGSSVSATVDDIERVMNRVIDIYERDSDVTFQLTAVVVRSSAADPYSSTDAGTLLDQFRSEWNSNFAGVRRDIAHLFTGKNINGGTIGVAYLGAVCSGSIAYGLSESRFTNNISARTGLTAHEIGHNFNQTHCDGNGDCRIMCAGLGGCQNDVTRFGTSRANGIRNYAASRGCMIDLAPPLAVPFTDDVPAASVNTDIWISNQGVVSSTGGVSEPSGTRSLQFNAANAGLERDDRLISNKILLGGETDFDVVASIQNRGVAAGNAIKIEILNSSGDWLEIIRVTSTGASESTYTVYSASVPASAYHDDAQLRITAEVDGSSENWYVDDISVTDDGCGTELLLCTGSPNSTGNPATLTNLGSTSISANDFTLFGGGFPPNQFGIVVYGGGFTFTPLGDGFLCVAGTPTLYRLVIFQADIFGSVTVPVDQNNLAPMSVINPGDVVNWQTWYRDSTPNGFNFSAAIGVTFCP